MTASAAIAGVMAPPKDPAAAQSPALFPHLSSAAPGHPGPTSRGRAENPVLQRRFLARHAAMAATPNSGPPHVRAFDRIRLAHAYGIATLCDSWPRMTQPAPRLFRPRRWAPDRLSLTHRDRRFRPSDTGLLPRLRVRHGRHQGACPGCFRRSARAWPAALRLFGDRLVGRRLRRGNAGSLARRSAGADRCDDRRAVAFWSARRWAAG